MALKAGRDKNDQQQRNPDDAREQRAKTGTRTSRRQGTKSARRNARAYGSRGGRR